MTTNATEVRILDPYPIRYYIPSDGNMLHHMKSSCQNFKPEPSKVLELAINLPEIQRREEHVIKTSQGHNFRMWENLQKRLTYKLQEEKVHVRACTHRETFK